MALYVVTGSPGCGKSTWVRTTAKPGDIRFGGDELANAITGKVEDKHHHDKTVAKISQAAREAGIREALKHRHEVDIYILISNLSREDESKYRRFDARFVIIDPGFDVALQRCKDHRPGYKHRMVKLWYDRMDQWPKDAAIVRDFTPSVETEEAEEVKPLKPESRGNKRGHRHQKRTAQLLAQLKDGEPCSWCGRPMHRDQVLHGEHSEAMKYAGDNALPDKLLHGACNEQRREGGPEIDRRAPILGATDAYRLLPIRMKIGGTDQRYPVDEPTNQENLSVSAFTWG